MSNHLHNPSYYRSHHYAHQFNLPDSAFVNRKLPVYTSEMPQGVNPFIHSHKKHFQRLGYQSIITQDHLINHQSAQQANSPAKNKDYYRNLSIEDIQGASTNTLISQALKNRIKAKEYYLRREKQRNMDDSGIRVHEATACDNASKQAEAEKLIKKFKNEANYHEKQRAIKTQQSSQSPPLYDLINNKKIRQYKNDLERTEKQLQDLQRRLEFAKKRVGQQKNEHNKKTPTIVEQRNTPISVEPIINSKQPSSELKLPKIDEDQYARNKNVVPCQEQQRVRQQKQRKRSYTQPNEHLQQGNYIYEQHYYPANDQIIQKEPQRDSSIDEKLIQSRLRRQQIRKLNPTYLSYGSFSGAHNPKMVYL